MMDFERETEEQRVERSSEVSAYIAERVSVDAESGCWIWAMKSRSGRYGKCSYRGSTWRAHRLAYHYLVKYLHRNTPVHHRCGVSLCVNPDHLQMTTHSDNTAEMLARTAMLEEIQALRDMVGELQEQIETMRRSA